jgi:hypothetical protein
VIDGSLTWVKSSYSGSQGGNCVEAAANGVGQVLVRDTMDRGGTVLTFRESRWREFSAVLKSESADKLADCGKCCKADIQANNKVIIVNLRGSAVVARGDFFPALGFRCLGG